MPAAELAPYLARVNRLLATKGHAPLTAAQLTGQINQFKAFVDLCHLYGIAVIADVVYNHAGGGFDDQSIRFFDRQPQTTDNNSLYFTDQDHAGGRVFAFWKQRGAAVPDRQRQVAARGVPRRRAALRPGHGDRGERRLVSSRRISANTLRFLKPEAVQIAEYWGSERWKGVAAPPHGMGFDVGYSDALRDTLREVIAEASGGRDARVNLDRLRDALNLTYTGRRALDRLPVHREPRPARLQSHRPRPPAAHSRARRSVERALLVRAQPRQGRDRASADGAGRPDDLHGPGVPGGQILDRLAGAAGAPDLVGRAGGSGQAHVRPAPLHARPDVAPAKASGAARRRAERLPCAQRQPRDRHAPLGAGGGARRGRGGEPERKHVPRPLLPHRLSRQAATGTRSSTATSTTSGSTPTPRAITAA